jgi:tRNA dimethylallyltransferase
MPGADPEIRKQLQLEAAQKGWPALHRRLAEVDPEAARRIHPNHSQRLGRALEVYLSSGVNMTEWLQRQQAQPRGTLSDTYTVLQLAICPNPRQLLHARIEQRLRLMLEAGFVDEVQGLYRRGDLHLDLPALRAVGYRQMWGYLQGNYDLDRARELALIATRQLAKRQLTWLRGWPGLQWIYTNAGGFAANNPESLEKSEEFPVQLALKYLSNATM